MKPALTRRIRFFAVGSLTTVIVAIAFVPFNMGGCSGPSFPILGGRGGGPQVDPGQVIQGGQKFGEGLTLTEEKEPALGQSVAVQAVGNYGLYGDDGLTVYVTKVGRTVGGSSGLKLCFGVLNSPKPNAFSGPDGYVFITVGALKLMHNEAELAGVLGHEIGHCVEHHGFKAMKAALMTGGALQIAAGTTKEVGQFNLGADKLGDIILNVGFGEPQELEADADGVSFLIINGYDPNGYLNFLKRIKAQQGSGAPFGTHPGLGDRINKVADQIAKSGAKGGATAEARFVAAMKAAKIQ